MVQFRWERRSRVEWSGAGPEPLRPESARAQPASELFEEYCAKGRAFRVRSYLHRFTPILDQAVLVSMKLFHLSYHGDIFSAVKTWEELDAH